MTITEFDGFAFTPKRCGWCKRLFIWESYNRYEREVSPISPPLVRYKCKACITKENKGE